MILVPVVKIPIDLRLWHSQEAVLEGQGGVSQGRKPGFDTDQLPEPRTGPMGIPMVREPTLGFGIVLIEFDVGIANHSVLFCQGGEARKELLNMGVASVVDEEVEGFNMATFSGGFDPSHVGGWLTEDNVEPSGRSWGRGERECGDVCGHFELRGNDETEVDLNGR